MKKPNITPGPWKWLGTQGNPSGIHYLRGAEYSTVGACLGSNFTDSKEDAKAIAAVPQLLEALENLIADWERVHGVIPSDHEAKAALLAAGYTE